MSRRFLVRAANTWIRQRGSSTAWDLAEFVADCIRAWTVAVFENRQDKSA